MHYDGARPRRSFAEASQVDFASRSHFVRKLFIAAPESFFLCLRPMFEVRRQARQRYYEQVFQGEPGAKRLTGLTLLAMRRKSLRRQNMRSMALRPR